MVTSIRAWSMKRTTKHHRSRRVGYNSKLCLLDLITNTLLDDYSVYDEVDTDEELLPELGSFEFSADPTIRCVEAIELADDLLEEAFDLVEKHMDILDDFHFESLESLEERFVLQES